MGERNSNWRRDACQERMESRRQVEGLDEENSCYFRKQKRSKEEKVRAEREGAGDR